MDAVVGTRARGGVVEMERKRWRRREWEERGAEWEKRRHSGLEREA